MCFPLGWIEREGLVNIKPDIDGQDGVTEEKTSLILLTFVNLQLGIYWCTERKIFCNKNRLAQYMQICGTTEFSQKANAWAC